MQHAIIERNFFETKNCSSLFRVLYFLGNVAQMHNSSSSSLSKVSRGKQYWLQLLKLLTFFFSTLTLLIGTVLCSLFIYISIDLQYISFSLYSYFRPHFSYRLSIQSIFVLVFVQSFVKSYTELMII